MFFRKENEMRRLFIVMLATALLMPISTGFAQEFPTAPPNLKEMETKGLPRVSTEELKELFPGVIDSRGPTGRHIVIHNADGTCIRKAAKHGVGQDASGKWRINEKNNTLCRYMPRMGKGVMAKGGSEEHCFALFRAADGMHFFEYDVQDGFYAHTWRKAPEQ